MDDNKFFYQFFELNKKFEMTIAGISKYERRAKIILVSSVALGVASFPLGAPWGFLPNGVALVFIADFLVRQRRRCRRLINDAKLVHEEMVKLNRNHRGDQQ